MSLPGADELFGRAATAHPAPAPPASGDSVEPLRAVPDGSNTARTRRPPRPGGERRPTGRERHDDKITVYVSAEELMDLEHARLTLRGEHGMAVDRGRIVREALALVIEDLEAKGESSVLVQRLRHEGGR
jgi:hypothetical protein